MEIKTGYNKGFEYMIGKELSIKFTFTKEGILLENSDCNNGELIFASACGLLIKILECREAFVFKIGMENVEQIEFSLYQIVDIIGGHLNDLSLRRSTLNDLFTGSSGTFGFGKRFRF